MQTKFKQLLTLCMVLLVATGLVYVSPAVETKAAAYNRVAKTTYNGHLYEAYDENLNWLEAQEYCESKGGHLVTITSAGENSAVTSMIKNGKRVAYCMGLRRTNTLHWVTGEKVSYTRWDKGASEPTNILGLEDYCYIVAKPFKFALHNYTPSYWADFTLDFPLIEQTATQGFVCEYEYIPLKDQTISTKVKLSSAKSSKKRCIKLTWKKSKNISGYYIQISKDKSFNKNVLEAYAGKSKKTITASRLNSKSTYYVRMRCYKTVKNYKVPGPWSSVKKVKVK